MSVELTPVEIDRLDSVKKTLAATKVRWLVEKKVMPRIGHMLGRSQVGEPVPACSHLVDMEKQMYRPAASIDWICEGVGMMCRDCTFMHMTDARTPHTDPRHECCIVCGHVGQDLKPLSATVELRVPLMVSPPLLAALSGRQGRALAFGWTGRLATTPITWECPEHDGFHDSKIELHWPPM